MKKRNKDKASLLFESLVAIVITTILLGALYTTSHRAMRAISAYQQDVSVNMRALNFQRYLDSISSDIRAPWWITNNFWTFDEDLAIPWYVTENDQSEEIFSQLVFHNTDDGIEVYCNEELQITFTGFQLLTVEPLKSDNSELRGMLLTVEIDDSEAKVFTLPLSGMVVRHE